MLSIKGLCKRFDDNVVLHDVSFEVQAREILGIFGPNGAGKSTLFNLLTGYIESDQGKIEFNGTDITNMKAERIARLGLRRTFQSTRIFGNFSVLDNVLLSMSDIDENPIKIFTNKTKIKISERQNVDLARSLLQKVNLLDKELDHANTLSYGQQKLVSLLCCIAARSSLVLLDEPISGVTDALAETIWLTIQHYAERGRAFVLIEHNTGFILQNCNRVICMNKGSILTEGNPQTVFSDSTVVDLYFK